MEQKSRFFDGIEYNAQDWADYFSAILSNGVFAFGTNLEVSKPDDADAVSHIAIGKAWINGKYYENDAEVLLTHDANTDPSYNRIDRVILRLNLSGVTVGVTATNTISLDILKGTPASSPVAPTLTRTGNVWELSLAQVLVPANSTTIPAANITDEREDSDVCGGVTSAFQDAQADTIVNVLLERYYDFVAETSKIISKSSGVINTTYDEKVYFYIPSYATTVEMLVIGRKPSGTVTQHAHGPHKHTIGVSDTRAVSGGYLHSEGGVVGAINVSSPGNAPNVVQNTTIGSGTPPATVAFPNGLTLRVNGTPTHGPYGDGSADYIGTWIDITSEITVDSVNYLEFLATTAGCVCDIEIRFS